MAAGRTISDQRVDLSQKSFAAVFAVFAHVGWIALLYDQSKQISVQRDGTDSTRQHTRNVHLSKGYTIH